MKTRAWSTLSILLVAALHPANAESQDAILRCDPYALIYEIDGKPDTQGGTGGAWFKDCAIPLSPGHHTLEVCYDASSRSMTTVTEARCDQPREISFDAAAGRTYRLRLRMGMGWNARVDDVTEAEAGLTYVQRPDKPRPANKAERTSTLVLQVSPAIAIPRFYQGKLLGPWFVPSKLEHKAENTGIAKAAPDGFVIVEVDAGDDLAITSLRLLVGSVFVPTQYFGCDGYQARVWHDIAGGKVLYLGHLTLAGSDADQQVSWSDDIDAARQYVDAHFPRLAGKLEPAPSTTRRLPESCALYPRSLSNAR
jgi:hypothetical protein